LPDAAYVPKYFVKRLIPSDAVTLENDVIRVKFMNVFYRIPNGVAPKNLKEYITVKIDGKIIFSRADRNLESKVWVEHNGQKYNLDELQKIGNGTIPLGDSLVIVMQNVFNFKKGETHRIEFDLDYKKPFRLDMERTLQ